MGIALWVLSGCHAQGDKAMKTKEVLIDDVPKLTYAESSGTTFVSALYSALANTEHPYSETQVMGLTGLAFRVRWSRSASGRWCPSIPVGEFPEERAAFAKLSGWEFLDISRMHEESDPHMERYTQEMVAAIDRGQPFVGYTSTSDLNCATCVGYRRTGDVVAFLWQCYGGPDDKPRETPAEKVGPWVMIPERFTKAPAKKEQLLGAIRIALKNWYRVEWASGPGEYKYLWGPIAMEHWIDDLGKAHALDEKKLGSLHFINWFNASTYAGARDQAAKFLREYAPAVTGETRKSIEAAADVYETLATDLTAMMFEKKTGFHGPWAGKSMKDWTPAVRKAEQDALRKALKRDTEAIQLLEKAMVAERVVVDGKKVTIPAAAKELALLCPKIPEGAEKSRGRWRSRGYIVMQTICARVAGWDVDYDTLMAVSGWGGSFAYHHKDYVVNYYSPGDVDGLVARATGFGWEWKRYATPEEYFDAIKETVNAGKIAHAPFMEEVLFAGYEDADDPKDRKVRPLAFVFVDTDWWTWEQFVDWHQKHSAGGLLGRHTSRVSARSARETALTTLGTLVEYSTKDPRATGQWDAKSGATFGLAGLETYAADIADLTKDGKKEGYFQGGWRGCHNIYPQLGGRWGVANYLGGLSKSHALSEGARPHIVAAAKEYQLACDAWEQWETHLGDRQKKGQEGWSDDTQRTAGATAIRKAIAHEKAGLVEIEKAIAAETKDNPKK